MLKFPAMTGVRRALASAAIVALVSSAGYASWAAQPGGAPAGGDRLAVGGAQQLGVGAQLVQTDFAITINGQRITDTGNDEVGKDLPRSERWETEFNPTKDGVLLLKDASHLTILSRIGQPFDLTARRRGESWQVAGASELHSDGTIVFTARVNHNNIQVSTPSLVVLDGAPAAIEVGDKSIDGKFKGFRLDLTLRKVDGPTARKLSGGAQMDTPPTEDLSYRRMYPPKYPAEAVRNRVTGKVMLKVSVDERGMPTSAEVESVKPEESARVLADAAIATAMKWRFNPGIKDGVPVGGSVMVPVDFMLRDDDGNPMPPPDPVSEINVSYRKMRPPVYPREAIAGKISGALYVRAHIDAAGNVADAYVDQAVPVSALVLKEPALAALKAWQFNPQTRNGAPIESDVLVPMQFRLEGEPAAPANLAAPTYPDSVKRLEAIMVTGSAS